MIWRFRISYAEYQLEGRQDAVEALAALLTSAGVECYVHRAPVDAEGRPGRWEYVPR